MDSRFERYWNQISTQLHLGFGTGLLLVIFISLMALVVIDRAYDVQRKISVEHMPEMNFAFAVLKQATTLATAVPRLSAVETQEQFDDLEQQVARRERSFLSRVDNFLEARSDNEQVQKIKSYGLGIIEDIEQTKDLVQERFVWRQHKMTLRLKAQQTHHLFSMLSASDLDVHASRIQTHSHAPGGVVEYGVETEFQIYRQLAELREAEVLAQQFLLTALTVTDSTSLGLLREQFDAALAQVEEILAELTEEPSHAQLVSTLEELRMLGQGDRSAFDIREHELEIEQSIKALLGHNQALGADLVEQVEQFSRYASLTATEYVIMADQTLSHSLLLLLAINLLSIAGAILFGWLMIEKRIIRRLERLAKSMERMAGGDLEVEIDTSGKDEIADLAKALEGFRKNALEVQRLNLVETLANDLKKKNADLERAQRHLKKAQDQVVMQEKLAALGELTAGVAHEIKNPMNFILNFSDSSKDLLEELLEEIEKNKPEGKADEEYDPELVADIAKDLVENLTTIREHGERANRIVVDMLKMGGASEDWQPVDLNVLLNQHAMLAFHSIRNKDSEFQLDIQEDYAENLPNIVAHSQDLSRVFVNLVINACYAMNERRKKAEKDAGEGQSDYQAQLKLTTREVDGHVEVRVRDNGGGIPASVREHIFNPFFTTKPPDEGTGLGLSLSADVVRNHGGRFEVETEEGDYTEMIITLPFEPESAKSDPQETGEEGAKSAGEEIADDSESA